MGARICNSRRTKAIEININAELYARARTSPSQDNGHYEILSCTLSVYYTHRSRNNFRERGQSSSSDFHRLLDFSLKLAFLSLSSVRLCKAAEYCATGPKRERERGIFFPSDSASFRFFVPSCCVVVMVFARNRNRKNKTSLRARTFNRNLAHRTELAKAFPQRP